MAQVRLARVIPSMHVHLCVALWLFSPRLSLFSTSSHRSPSSPSRCSPQCSTRGSGPTPCATSAWGPWPLLTTRHPSHREEPLLGRNAHSARYGELIHDRRVKLVSVHHQEQAYFENFVMSSDAAEFVNKVKDQVAKQTEKNVERCRVR